eukprot:3940700-Rhodomonas_salina.1
MAGLLVRVEVVAAAESRHTQARLCSKSAPRSVKTLTRAASSVPDIAPHAVQRRHTRLCSKSAPRSLSDPLFLRLPTPTLPLRPTILPRLIQRDHLSPCDGSKVSDALG